MQSYAHLAQEERYHLEMMRREGISIQRIAAGMNRSPSTGSRKLTARRQARQPAQAGGGGWLGTLDQSARSTPTGQWSEP